MCGPPIMFIYSEGVPEQVSRGETAGTASCMLVRTMFSYSANGSSMAVELRRPPKMGLFVSGDNCRPS
jgi:hypothetical protein